MNFVMLFLGIICGVLFYSSHLENYNESNQLFIR